MEFQIDYAPISHLYAREQIKGTLYLAFREVPELLRHYLPCDLEHPLKALDFGCGTGVSTRYLKSQKKLFKNGLEVEGIDLSSDMLKLARAADPEGKYYQTKQNKIPVQDHYYDLIFSTFVLFEFATKDKMQQALEEISRVMRPGAIFIAVTGSIETYNRQNQWVSLDVDFPQNEHLTSGDLGRVDFMVDESVLTLQNYYWTEKDYQEVFKKALLELKNTLHPLGNKAEEKNLSWQWKSETEVSPYYTFILSSN